MRKWKGLLAHESADNIVEMISLPKKSNDSMYPSIPTPVTLLIELKKNYKVHMEAQKILNNQNSFEQEQLF